MGGLCPPLPLHSGRQTTRPSASPLAQSGAFGPCLPSARGEASFPLDSDVVLVNGQLRLGFACATNWPLTSMLGFAQSVINGQSFQEITIKKRSLNKMAFWGEFKVNYRKKILRKEKKRIRKDGVNIY